MERWFSSDWHVGHRNIVHYTGRPYSDVESMVDGLVERWNAHVRPSDEVWLLGDLAMGRIEESLRHVRRFRGHLRLVPGNHDRCWRGNGPKAERWRRRYLEAGVVDIVDDPAAIRVGGARVELSHFPYVGGGDSREVERFGEWRPDDTGGWLQCGHVHDAWRQHGRQINVGVDAWGGRPVHVDELAELISAGPAELPPLEW